jgi:hypothetical protein
MSRFQSLRVPFSARQDGWSALATRDVYDGSPSSIAGFAFACTFIVAFLALLLGTIVTGLHLHERRRRSSTRRKGGRLGLVLAAGEMFTLLMLAVDGFCYGWLATSKSVMISHIK